jgi:hypothetical protein
MKFVLEIELGNDAMQTVDDVVIAMKGTLRNKNGASELQVGEYGTIKDLGGSTVGKWEVSP